MGNIINSSRFAGGGGSALQAKFISWIEDGDSTDKVTSTTWTGTASLAGSGNGSFTDGWTNGTLSGPTLASLNAFTIVLSANRSSTFEGGSDQIELGGGDCQVRNLTGTQWRFDFDGSIINIGTPNNADLIVFTREAGSTTVKYYVDNVAQSDITISTATISSATVSISPTNVTITSLVAVADSALSVSEVSTIWDSGNLLAWADLP